MKKLLSSLILLLFIGFWFAINEVQINPVETKSDIKWSYQLDYFSSQGKKYSVWFPVFLNFGKDATFRLCTTYNWNYNYENEILSSSLTTKNTNWCNNIYRSSIQYSFTNEIQYNSKAWIEKDRLFIQTTKKIFVFKKI